MKGVLNNYKVKLKRNKKLVIRNRYRINKMLISCRNRLRN